MITTRGLYFSCGSAFSICLVYILREGFLIYPFIIMCLIVIILIFMETREAHYKDFLRKRRGE